MSPDRAAVGPSARFTRVNSAPRDLATRAASFSPPFFLLPPVRPPTRLSPALLSSFLSPWRALPSEVTPSLGEIRCSCAREPLRDDPRVSPRDYEIAWSPTDRCDAGKRHRAFPRLCLGRAFRPPPPSPPVIKGRVASERSSRQKRERPSILGSSTSGRELSVAVFAPNRGFPLSAATTAGKPELDGSHDVFDTEIRNNVKKDWRLIHLILDTNIS